MDRIKVAGGLLPGLLVALLLFCATEHSFAQTYLETFGQNRVQSRKFDWRYFDTDHFRVYHYDAAGRQLARYLSEQAEKDIAVIEQKLGGQFPRRFKIILYNNYDEYRQTNVGKKYELQNQESAGTVDLVGDRLVVYFTGAHTDLRRQLRSGMSKIVMQRLLFGESFKEMVKNAVMLSLPKWTTEGYIAYMVDGWDAKSDNEWKNLLAANPEKGFYELSELHPEIAGKAFWKFVSAKYGDNMMKNLLYTMETKSSLNTGIKMTMGIKVKYAYDSCMSFYNAVYLKDAQTRSLPDSAKLILEIPVPKDNGQVRNMRVSPRGNDVAYVVWKDGEYKVYLQHTQDEQTRTLIMSGGRKDFNETHPDQDYPLLCWSNSGYKLAMLYRREATAHTQTRLRIYNSLKAKIEEYVIPPNRFDRITGMTFMENDDKMVFSAIKKSQTDLYEFTIKGLRMKNISNDAWDDLSPWFVSGGSRRGILFLSNRPAASLNVPIAVNELPVGPMNVFFYDTKTQSTTLLKCSNINSGNVSQPIQYGSDNMAFLYDSSGIVNKYVVVFGRDSRNMDSAYSVPITNYNSSIVTHQYNPASNQVADVVQEGDQFQVYFHPLEMPGVNVEPKMPLPITLLSTGNTNVTENGFQNINELSTPVDQQPKEQVLKSGNVFQSEFTDEPPVVNTDIPVVVDTTNNSANAPIETSETAILDDTSEAAVDSSYLKMKPSRYRLSLKPDFFTVKVDNSVLFNRYQSVRYSGGQFSNPPIAGLLSVSLNDVLENHRFTGGIRLPMNFSTPAFTYFLQYENFTRRVDWGVLFLRTPNYYNFIVNFQDPAGNIIQNEQLGKVTSNILQMNATFPFDRVRSIRLFGGFRQDVLDFKAQDTLSLAFSPRETQYWATSRAELVFDNSIAPMLNIHKGTRFKLYGEYLYLLNGEGGGMYNFGADIRHYEKVYKNITFASRMAFSHSAGKQRVVYYLGGVDNWILPRQSSNIPPSDGNSYAFQALATNLRGYDQSARIGNTYAVANAELRAPIFNTLLRRPIQSSLLRNLQAVAFLDVGSAWFGLVPNADGFVGTKVAQSQNVTTVIDIPGSTGIAMGYGAGLRTLLFGYFFRVDAAWNIEGKPKPTWYFSIGTDF